MVRLDGFSSFDFLVSVIMCVVSHSDRSEEMSILVIQCHHVNSRHLVGPTIENLGDRMRCLGTAAFSLKSFERN